VCVVDATRADARATINDVVRGRRAVPSLHTVPYALKPTNILGLLWRDAARPTPRVTRARGVRRTAHVAPESPRAAAGAATGAATVVVAVVVHARTRSRRRGVAAHRRIDVGQRWERFRVQDRPRELWVVVCVLHWGREGYAGTRVT